MMTENAAKIIATTPYFKDGFSFQTGAGSPSLAVNRFIEELKNKAYSLVGTPADLKWENKVVAIVEARDGTILDVVRKIIDKKINLLYYICMHIHIFLKVVYGKNK